MLSFSSRLVKIKMWFFFAPHEPSEFHSEDRSGRQGESEATLETHHWGSWSPVQCSTISWTQILSGFFLLMTLSRSSFLRPWAKVWLASMFSFSFDSHLELPPYGMSQSIFLSRVWEREAVWPRFSPHPHPTKKNQAISSAADQSVVRLLLKLVFTLDPINRGMRRGGDMV